ncbi:MAG: hypothetical protein AAFU56_08355 [Pseudomonadota bacterium]
MLKKLTIAGVSALALTGCEVEPSDPDGEVSLTIQEIRRGGNFPIVFTNRPGQTPARTTCADGRLPPAFRSMPDTADTWNQYYVMQPGQTEIGFLMVIRSGSGVTAWIIDVSGPSFDVTNPMTEPLPDGRTVFGFRTVAPYYDRTIRLMELAIAEGVQPSEASAPILTILSTGNGTGLPSDEDTFTLIAAC